MKTSLAMAACSLALPACLMMPMSPNRGSAPSAGGASEPASVPTAGASPTSGTSPGDGAPKGSSGPELDSITLHNDCKKTVKLFLGDKPKFGSGTTTSITTNTTQSYTLGAGKKIWIIDDSENGVSAYVGQAGSHRLKIPESCTSFASN